MKVYLFSTGFYEYMIELANALTAHCEVILSLPSNRINSVHTSLISPQVKFEPFTLVDYASVRDNYKMLREIAAIIRKNSPDVIHLQTYGSKYFWLLYPLLAGKKIINTVHDPRPHTGDKVSKQLPFLKKVIGSITHKYIVHGEVLKQELIQDEKIAGDKVVVVPHGHLGLFKHWRVKTENREPHTFLFFGRIWQYKGLKYFIEAANIVGKEFADCRFIIAGTGEQIEPYRQLIKNPAQFEIRNYRIPEAEIDELFQRSVGVVLPYTDATQSGVIPVAIAYQTIIIASKVGAIPEVITSGYNGILVEPQRIDALEKAMRSVVTDITLVQKLKKGTSETLKGQLNWNNIAAQTYRVYAG